MVQWTAKPAPRDPAAHPGTALELLDESEALSRPKARPQRKRTLAPLYVAMIALIGAVVPASYLLLARSAPAQETARHDPAERELTTGRIIISDQAGCRERGFNNYNGQSTEKGAVQCSAIAPRAQGLTERLDTIRRAFSPQ